MLDYTVMDTHDKQLLMKIGDMVEDIQRRVQIIEARGAAAALTPMEAQEKTDRKAEKEAEVEALSASDRALYDALRDWRRKLATSLGRSPMTICHDRALLALIKRHPADPADQPW